MNSTKAVEVIIHATSPLLQSKPLSPHFGVGAAAAASAGAAVAAAASAGAAAAGAAAAGAEAAGAAGASSAMAMLPNAATAANSSTRAVLVRGLVRESIFMSSLQCVFAGFAGTDADGLIQRQHEHLAVADLARVCRLGDDFDRGVELVVGDCHFNLHLRQEIDYVFRTAVQLGVALLATETLDLRDGDAGDADHRKSLTHLVKLEQ